MQPRVSSDYIFSLFELLEENGHSPTELLNRLNLDVQASGRMSLIQLEQLLKLIDQHYSVPALGLKVGMRMGTSKHGFMGYAAKSSETVADALLIDQRYINTRVEGVHFRFVRGTQKGRIQIETDDLPERTRVFLIELVVASLVSFHEELFPKTPLNAELSLACMAC